MHLSQPPHYPTPQRDLSPALEILYFSLSILCGFVLFGISYRLLSLLITDQLLCRAIAQNIFFFGSIALIYTLFRFGKRYRQALGLTRPQSIITPKNRVIEICIILGGTLFVFILSLLVQSLFQSLFSTIHGKLGDWLAQDIQRSHEVLHYLQKYQAVSSRIIQILIFGVLTGFCEELVMRGSLQPLLIRITKNTHWGIILTSILFSLLHLSLLNFIPILILSLWLGYLRHYSGSIILGVLIHILNNSLALFQSL